MLKLPFPKPEKMRANLPALVGSLGDSLRHETRWRGRLLFVVALLPTILAALYFGLLASDRYISEAQFVVRSATRSGGGGGLAAFLQLAGVSTSQDDTFAVHDFFTSRDAVTQLVEKVPLAEIYARDGADWVSRFPSVFYGNSQEEFRRYLKRRIIVSYNSNTGISTFQVEAFTPADAHLVAKVLLDLGEQVINRLNRRIRDDAVKFAVDEVLVAEKRMMSAQLSISEFRNREAVLDPGKSSAQILELIGKLAAELGNAEATLAEMNAASPNTPQAMAMQRRVQALRSQISLERGRITNDSDGLAQKIAQYEQLVLERELAGKTLASAIASLDSARVDARRQQLYLERISGPSLPDDRGAPRRLTEFLSILAMNIVLLLILWLFRAGVAEHAPKVDQA